MTEHKHHTKTAGEEPVLFHPDKEGSDPTARYTATAKDKSWQLSYEGMVQGAERSTILINVGSQKNPLYLKIDTGLDYSGVGGSNVEIADGRVSFIKPNAIGEMQEQQYEGYLSPATVKQLVGLARQARQEGQVTPKMRGGIDNVLNDTLKPIFIDGAMMVQPLDAVYADGNLTEKTARTTIGIEQHRSYSQYNFWGTSNMDARSEVELKFKSADNPKVTYDLKFELDAHGNMVSGPSEHFSKTELDGIAAKLKAACSDGILTQVELDDIGNLARVDVQSDRKQDEKRERGGK